MENEGRYKVLRRGPHSCYFVMITKEILKCSYYLRSSALEELLEKKKKICIVSSCRYLLPREIPFPLLNFPSPKKIYSPIPRSIFCPEMPDIC